MRYWSTSVGYGRDDARSYWLIAHEMPLRSWVYWQVREWLAWAPPHRLLNRFPVVHSWWVDHMELPATVALEIRNQRRSVEVTEVEHAALLDPRPTAELWREHVARQRRERLAREDADG